MNTVRGHAHQGIDLAAPEWTPVRSIASGTVTQVVDNSPKTGYGNQLVIDHGSYNSPFSLYEGQAMTSRYAHLKTVSMFVTEGSHVSKGQIIGFVGSTGFSTGPHLHFEILMNNQRIFPGLVIPGW